MADFIIVGAGITGLTCAYKLKKEGASVLVLEEAGIAGGKITTDRINGYLLESGPNSLRVENKETANLLKELEIEDRLIEASPNAKKRFILKHAKWVQVPIGPLQAISTTLFSPLAKLRLLGEVFTTSSKAQDESVASFFIRHFGREVYEYAADAFVTGIYAGDPTRLSVRHSFKIFWQLDQEFGSMIVGMVRRKKPQASERVKKRIVSFPNGLGELTGKLKEELKEEIVFHEAALKLERDGESYTLRAGEKTYTAKNIILALPSYKAYGMISELSDHLSGVLRDIEYPPVAVAYLGYREEQFAQKIEGFGGLIPSKEKRKILGVIYSSSNFAGRAPEGHVLLTVIAGGAKHPEVVTWDEKQIVENAEREIEALYPVTGKPAFRSGIVWKHAIPQYNVGFDKVLSAIEAAERELPGLHFIGNYRGGISMGSCIKTATELAARLV
jgi:oxygen-dependent protoporphyrinogen oxidase